MAYMPRSVVDNRRPVATAKSKNTSTTFITERRRRRQRRGFVNIHASNAMQWPSLKLFEGKFSRGISSLFADEARNTYLFFVLICRVSFSCCGRVAWPQAAVWAPAWAPRSWTCAHVDNGASTPEARPQSRKYICVFSLFCCAYTPVVSLIYIMKIRTMGSINVTYSPPSHANRGVPTSRLEILSAPSAQSALIRSSK